MKKDKIILYFLIVLIFLFFSCAEKKSTSSQIEKSEQKIVVVEDENNFELTDFIDFPAWEFIGKGMDILKDIDYTESIEQLQYKLNLAAGTMIKAKTAFISLKDIPEVSNLAEYPIQIIDLYIEVSENFALKNGDPKSLEGLKKADSLLIELIELLEKEVQSE